MLRRLNTEPMSTKAAIDAGPKIGRRYSKFPSSCVSPPINLKFREKRAELSPPTPVNAPRAAISEASREFSPVFVSAGPEAVLETTTFFAVMYVLKGAMGPMARES